MTYLLMENNAMKSVSILFVCALIWSCEPRSFDVPPNSITAESESYLSEKRALESIDIYYFDYENNHYLNANRLAHFANFGSQIGQELIQRMDSLELDSVSAIKIDCSPEHSTISVKPMREYGILIVSYPLGWDELEKLDDKELRKKAFDMVKICINEIASEYLGHELAIDSCFDVIEQILNVK